jgi:hypothetical protein
MDDDKKQPPRHVRAIIRADLWIVAHVSTPVARWVDWRFHINQYDLGAGVLSAGLALNFADNIKNLTTLSVWWIALFGVLGSGMLIMVYSHYLKLLNIASRQYERRPDQLTREQAFFMVPIYPPLRLALIILGNTVTAAEVTSAIKFGTMKLIEGAIFSPWMTVIGCALYICGSFPPHASRKEKKVYAPPSLALQSR